MYINYDIIIIYKNALLKPLFRQNNQLQQTVRRIVVLF